MTNKGNEKLLMSVIFIDKLYAGVLIIYILRKKLHMCNVLNHQCSLGDRDSVSPFYHQGTEAQGR